VVYAHGVLHASVAVMDKIIVPDAAIREYNKKYGKYLPKPQVDVPIPIDEDAMYEVYLELINKGEDNV
jgi:hypothetical protein